MLKKTITFKDLDGNDVTEDFHFNISPTELAEMEISDTDAYSDKIKRIIESENVKEIWLMFKDLLTRAVGRRSEDGRRFIKDQEAIDRFFQSDAYNVLFLEWMQDASKAADFMNAIMPANLDEIAANLPASRPVNDVQLPAEEPAYIRENRDPTPQELTKMSQAELQEAFRRRAARQ